MPSQFEMDFMRQRSVDPRFPGQQDFGLPPFDMFQSNRSSKCNTPSFEMPFNSANSMMDKNVRFFSNGLY